MGGGGERRLDREAAAVLSPPPQPPPPPPPPPLSFAPLALLQSLGWGIGPLYRSLILKVIKSWAVGLFCSVTNGVTKSHHPRPASLMFGILRGITTSQNFVALFSPQTLSSYMTFIHFPVFARFVEKYGSHGFICHIAAYQCHWTKDWCFRSTHSYVYWLPLFILICICQMSSRRKTMSDSICWPRHHLLFFQSCVRHACHERSHNPIMLCRDVL